MQACFAQTRTEKHWSLLTINAVLQGNLALS